MRPLFLVSLLVLIIVGCRKRSDVGEPSPGSHLTGRWEYSKSYFGTGGLSGWHPVQPAGQLIAFNDDGSFSSVASFSPDFRRYKVVDSTTVKFWPAKTVNGYVVMRFQIDPVNGTLVLTPIEPMCVEGCSYKFRRK